MEEVDLRLLPTSDGPRRGLACRAKVLGGSLWTSALLHTVVDLSGGATGITAFSGDGMPESSSLASEGGHIEPDRAEPIAYRPSRAASVFITSVWIVAALSLAWVGAVVGPESRSGMDGLPLLLFTVVPIRPFSWIMAAVPLVLAIRVGRIGLRDAASLVVSSDGLTLSTGDVVPWSTVRSAVLDRHGRLVIRFEAESVTLSSFDLGTDPAAVAADLSRRLAALRPPSGQV